MDGATLVNLVADAEVLKSLQSRDLYRLAQDGSVRQFSPGEVLMRQGEHGDSMHLVLRGCVRVQARAGADLEPVVVAELGPGAVIGEMAILERSVRAADVLAVDETETLELGRHTVERLVREYPEFEMALRALQGKRQSSLAQSLGRTA